MKKNKVAAEIWFKKARDHLSFAKAGWKESRIVSDTCVLCQQTAEKALKSLLELENIEVEKMPSLKTHRLVDIY
jgi:HEPN domain-containing protein